MAELLQSPAAEPTGQSREKELSIEEQQIIAEIQELQRHLRELKAREESDDDEDEDDTAARKRRRPRRVLIVANRLPIRASRDARTARWTFDAAPGGLATALRGIASDVQFIWVGWVGADVPAHERPRVAERLLREHGCYPVFLEAELVTRYYNGFCNDVLWPLFHYVPLPMYQAGAEKKFDASLWEAYKEANSKFADAVLEVYAAGRGPSDGSDQNSSRRNRDASKTSAAAAGPPPDYVWVHDYHLMRLPLELRKRDPRIATAWFLHTPFPSSEIYRILPYRRELLEGLLHADLVGFHTYDYARHFLSACSRVLDVSTTTPKGIEFGGRFCSIGVFPIGIDPALIRNTLRSRAVRLRTAELGATFRGRKVLIGVDRLDYIKGMPHKLLAFELFLSRNPGWVGKVTLIQVGVPTRTEVPEYQALAKHVNELVGRINGVYGTLEYSPIHYINQSIPQDELIAIYHLADACLVTSVRDGMNLVSHEYVAAQEQLAPEPGDDATRSARAASTTDAPSVVEAGAGYACDEGIVPGDATKERRRRRRGEELDEKAASPPNPPFVKDGPGSLVLSEFAGSAQSLSGAIRVNPWNTEELARAMHDALTLTRVERELRWAKLHRYVTTNTASYWARSFVDEFRDVCEHPPLLPKLPRLPAGQVLGAYARAKHRLVVTDYDGTLMQTQSLPRLATPAPVVTQLLATLSRDPRNTVYVMSGRERRFMEKWLGKLKVGLAAEFGYCHRAPNDPPGAWTALGRDLDTSWKDVVRPIMQYFAERTPGTYIESKESSLAWHYRDADPHFGAWQAKDMQIHMEDVMSNLPLEILQGNRLVEVRHIGVNKSLVLEEVLRQGPSGADPAAPPPPATSSPATGSRGAFGSAREFGDPPSTPAAAAPEADSSPSTQAEPARGEEFDFVLCVGDDRSDEDMYQLLKAWHARRAAERAEAVAEGREADAAPAPALYLVHIGTGATHAEFCLESVIELRKVLRGMASISLKDQHLHRS
mmetsp:Transcript_20182/g.63481  ORF Transcript_20182/g.63481 Transcript_20182/m.63481 type:complete len:996 (+) Transcript_20182:205-3192(+)